MIVAIAPIQSSPGRAGAAIVISEVMFAPVANSGNPQWVELYNNGTTAMDLNNWWMCVQPDSQYFRLLRVPQFTSGPPQSMSITLGPGEYLGIRWDQGVNGNYSSGPCTWNPNVTCHQVYADPDAGTPIAGNSPLPNPGNLSVYQFTGIGGNFPNFGAVLSMRDIAAWSSGGVYVGCPRVWEASQAGLWPLGLGSCPNTMFVAVNSATIEPGSGLSIQYSGTAFNGPADYFIAPATWISINRRRILDADGDGDVDLSDYHVFIHCFGNEVADAPCTLEDPDNDGWADLADLAWFQNSFTGSFGS